jgi:hypothetical protein
MAIASNTAKGDIGRAKAHVVSHPKASALMARDTVLGSSRGFIWSKSDKNGYVFDAISSLT